MRAGRWGACAACFAFAISPPFLLRLSLAFLCVVGRQVRNRSPPSLWSPSHTRHQPRPRSHAARLGFRCHRSSRRLSRRHPPPRLKKNSILSYCSACAVALPGECPLGTRFLHRFYIRWHIAQAPGHKFTSNRIRPIPKLLADDGTTLGASQESVVPPPRGHSRTMVVAAGASPRALTPGFLHGPHRFDHLEVP